jgi:hypothetical protein
MAQYEATVCVTIIIGQAISTASFQRPSTYPDVTSNNEVPQKSKQWHVLMLWPATADFSGWCWHMYLLCSLHLSSTVFPLCPRYTFPHSRGIRYTPGALSPTPSLADLSMCAVLCFGDVNLPDIMFLQKSTDVYWLGKYTSEHRTNTSLMCFMWHQLNVLFIKNKRQEFSALFRNHLTERVKKQIHNLTVLLPSEWYIT